MIHIFFTHWELIKNLTRREIIIRYKQSFLGFFWIILNPFFQMLIMSFVFSYIMKVNNLGVPYPIYLYAGLLPWNFFSGALSSSMTALIDGSSLIKKIYFPREILVISTITAKAFDFFLASFVFILLMLWYRIQFTPYMLFFFPIFLLQFMFTYAISLLLSFMNLLYRDIQYLFNLVIVLWFYLTPVLYAVEFFPPQYRWVFQINPMSVFINAYREVLLAQGIPNLTSLGIGVALTAVIFVIAYYLFKKAEGMFADVV